MAVYNYSGSLIDQISLKRSEHQRGDIAYLRASGGADRSKLSHISATLQKAGWDVAPVVLDNTPTLEVRGFGKDKKLLSVLAQAGGISGSGQLKQAPGDHISTEEKLKKGTLQASGLAYIIGDLGFATYGYKDHNPLNIAAGIAYFLGSNSLVWFGRRDQSQNQIRDIADKMNRFLHEEKIPQGRALKEATEDKSHGFMGKMHQFFAKYPAEIMNMFFAIAGLCIMLAVRKDLARLKLDKIHLPGRIDLLKHMSPNATKEIAFLEYQRDHIKGQITAKYMDIGLGAMTVASGLGSVFVKEKAPDPTKPKRKGFGGLIDWVREKPLRIAGYGYIGSTLCHAVSTALEVNHANKYMGHFGNGAGQPDLTGFTTDATRNKVTTGFTDAQDKKSSLAYRSLFVGANLVAEGLMAVSSKGHGEGVKDSDIDNSVYALAAETVLHQPHAAQAALIERLAGRLAARDALSGKASDHAEGIRQQLAGMASSPWVQPAKKGASNAPKPEIAADAALATEPAKLWQSRVAATPAATAQVTI